MNILIEYIRLILEKERRYEKEDPVSLLEKYVNKENVFIHFSSLKEKVGVNPQSKFNTPMGVYAYPLDKNILEQIKDNKIPFRSELPYLHVIQPK